MNTLDKLKMLFSDLFNVEEKDISLETNRNNLSEWDSLGHISLISMVEEEFGMSIDAEDIISIMSVNDLIRLISDQ